MTKKYVGPEKPPSQKDEKGKTKQQEELKQIKIKKQELADEKEKIEEERGKIEEERDNFNQEIKKGDEDMEPKEMERELKDLRGNITELLGIEKERQRQDSERRSKEEEDKRLKTIVDPLQNALNGVRESVKGVKDDFNKFCEMNPEDPRCKKFTDQVSQTIKQTLKPKEEEAKKKEEKKDESKPPESQIVSEEDKKLFGELTDMRAYYKGLTGEEAKRPITIVAGVAKEALSKIAESDSKATSDLAQRFIPEKIVQEIKKGFTDINSISAKDKTKLFLQECQGPDAPAFCKILKEEGFNIQEKKKGSMPGSSGWKDIA